VLARVAGSGASRHWNPATRPSLCPLPHSHSFSARHLFNVSAASPTAAVLHTPHSFAPDSSLWRHHRHSQDPTDPTVTTPTPQHRLQEFPSPAMDSMRSLNTSLPKTRRRQPAPQPDTHQSFRTAALAVTTLYKAALADIDRSRTDGYQDALEDLIGFLDKQNLGVGDGEGWQIRQWVMERLDGGLPVQSTSDSGDEDLPEEQRARSSSPAMERNSSPEETRAPESIAAPNHQRCDSAPPLVSSSPITEVDMSPLPPLFQFSSPQAYPVNSTSDNHSYDISAAGRRAFPNPRRPSHRASSRNMQRAAAQNLFSLGNGSGQKRRFVPDLFNVDMNDRRDGSGGGSKRGRMT
jgi:hypothetical protein